MTSEMEALTPLVKYQDVMFVAASDMIDFDPENQVPVCKCCGMELDIDEKGHRANCLAEAILEETKQ